MPNNLSEAWAAALVLRLHSYVLGPEKCPRCGAPRASNGCEEPCSYKMDYGLHSTSIHGSVLEAKEDMIRAASIIQTLFKLK